MNAKKTSLVAGVLLGLLLPAVVVMVPDASAQTKSKSVKKLTTMGSTEKGSANTIGKFNRTTANKNLYHVNGKVTAVSASSISVNVVTVSDDANTNGALVTTNYTFAIDANTLIIRKFKGKATVDEITVGDKVKVYATALTNGTAKLIWDKSIWYASASGKVSDINTTDKTFKLTITRKNVEYSTTVKTNDATTYWMGATEKTFADLTSGSTVTVKGSWNSVGKYFLAKKVTWQ